MSFVELVLVQVLFETNTVARAASGWQGTLEAEEQNGSRELLVGTLSWHQTLMNQFRSKSVTGFSVPVEELSV